MAVAEHALLLHPHRILGRQWLGRTMHIERVTIRPPATHHQGAKHVVPAASGKSATTAAAPAATCSATTAAACVCTLASRSRTSHSVLSGAAAREEILEDARRKKRGEPIVWLRQFKTMQTCERRCLGNDLPISAKALCRSPTRSSRHPSAKSFSKWRA